MTLNILFFASMWIYLWDQFLQAELLVKDYVYLEVVKLSSVDTALVCIFISNLLVSSQPCPQNRSSNFLFFVNLIGKKMVYQCNINFLSFCYTWGCASFYMFMGHFYIIFKKLSACVLLHLLYWALVLWKLNIWSCFYLKEIILKHFFPFLSFIWWFFPCGSFFCLLKLYVIEPDTFT